MNQKNNNARKSKKIDLFPSDFRKTLQLVKTELSQVELKFLENQLKRRTDLPITDEESMMILDNKFLVWFLEAILPAHSDFGTVISNNIVSKIKAKMEWVNY